MQLAAYQYALLLSQLVKRGLMFNCHVYNLIFGNSSFVITVDNHKPLRLKVSETGKIVGFDKISQERLSKRSYLIQKL